ncbi:hypothetical protein UP09_08390 [Bradyrhizobium sp. LTSP885]|uniref:MFS transporter n=1 Tax=Bradyrhizobium sp. LTSP885 TaxID=1619232 RepID=UPI0005E40CB3|nr:MFS transporter [Bradyrhizobium sp. LTSP885]KJC48739.1 hypothetical protein UP09_08390 [Bradyrhizobium sp. LTSP885]
MSFDAIQVNPSATLSSANGGLDPTYRKITRRIAPILLIGYALAFLDRINIGFAQLQIKTDLGFNDAVYGTAAAIFFLGYLFCEVPSNLLLEKIGARLTVFRIMFLWGVVAALTSLIQTPGHFYAARFLLGIFEAGLVPGFILYLTYWYPPRHRAKLLALMQLGPVVAGIIAGPLSAWIISTMDGAYGLMGWQWMFILEGIPSCLFAIGILFLLEDKPDRVAWLSDAEKSAVISQLQTVDGSTTEKPTTFRAMLADKRTWVLTLIYFTVLCAIYAGTFWMPMIIKASGATILQTGLYSAIPFLVSAFAIWFGGKNSDAKRERRWHFSAAAFAMIIGFILLITMKGSLVASLIALTLIISGGQVCAVVFWPIPSAYLSATAAAAGIALINTGGVMGGFVSPFALGYIQAWTGDLAYGLYFMIALLTVGIAAMLILVPANIETQAFSSNRPAAQDCE